MYLLNEMLLFLPLVVYTGFRLRRLIARRLWKNLFTLFYALLLPAFPLAERLSHAAGNARSSALIEACYDALPYLMYLVLLVVLADLAIGALRLLKILRPETVSGPGFQRARFWTMVLAPAGVVAFGILNFNHLQVSRYAIEVPSKSSGIERLRIVFAADFHLGLLTRPSFMPRFADAVNALEPDLVLIGGDVVEGDRGGEAAEAYAAQFRRIRAKYGVFGAPGNHESYAGNPTDFFAKSGIRLLRDEIVKIDSGFYVIGRNDGGRSRSGRRKPIGVLLQGASEDFPVILIDHRPIDLAAVSRTTVDIQVSGHTHNGQLFPVNFLTKRQYGLSWGHEKRGHTDFFVTSGVQLWGPRVRTAGVSEIMLIDVAFRPGH